MGLFATRRNSTTFYFDPSIPGVTERFFLKSTTHPEGKKPSTLQGFYIAQFPKGEEVSVCTTDSLRVRAIHHTFMINHRPEKKDPTHVFDQCNSRHIPCLVPRRYAEENEEYTFDYNQRKPGVKDVDTVPDEESSYFLSSSSESSSSEDETKAPASTPVIEQHGNVDC